MFVILASDVKNVLHTCNHKSRNWANIMPMTTVNAFGNRRTVY